MQHDKYTPKAYFSNPMYYSQHELAILVERYPEIKNNRIFVLLSTMHAEIKDCLASRLIVAMMFNYPKSMINYSPNLTTKVQSVPDIFNECYGTKNFCLETCLHTICQDPCVTLVTRPVIGLLISKVGFTTLRLLRSPILSAEEYEGILVTDILSNHTTPTVSSENLMVYKDNPEIQKTAC